MDNPATNRAVEHSSHDDSIVQATTALSQSPEASQQQFQVESNGRSNGQELQKLDSQFSRIESSFQAIASQHKLPHRRLLALDKIASYHGVPKGTFRRAFQMWLESTVEGGK